MYNGKLKIWKNDIGSVMMETVLVLPLYIAFFSGIFLVGDLQACVGRLYAADRTAVVQSGNRHITGNISTGDLTKVIFGSNMDYGSSTRFTNVSASSTPSVWGHIVDGNSTLTFTLPSWTRGWQRAVNHVFGNSKADWAASDTIALDGYYTFMRKADSSREDQCGEMYGTGSWSRIASEPFLTGDATGFSSSAMGSYTRYSQYVTWSGK